MKISELNNKAFLGSAGAAENSYVLINYEDSETDAPVTYKATLQELGRAIANDQQLYKKTQNGAVTTNVSQGAYVNTAAENFASTGYVTSAAEAAIAGQHLAKFDIQSSYLKYYSSSNILSNVTTSMISGAASTGYVDGAVSGLASTGYVNTAIEDLASTNYVVNAIDDYATNQSLASIGDIDYAVNGLASTGYVTNAVSGLTSTGYVTDAISNLVSATELGIDRANNHYGAVQNNRLKYFDSLSTTELVTVGMISGAASTGYVTNAISGLASTGYVTAAVANAGGGNMVPSGALFLFESDSTYIIGEDISDSSQDNLSTIVFKQHATLNNSRFSPIMAQTDDTNIANLYVYDSDNNISVAIKIHPDHLPTEFNDDKMIVTVSQDGQLYYYDKYDEEYKLVSSLQNNN